MLVWEFIIYPEDLFLITVLPLRKVEMNVADCGNLCRISGKHVVARSLVCINLFSIRSSITTDLTKASLISSGPPRCWQCQRNGLYYFSNRASVSNLLGSSLFWRYPFCFYRCALSNQATNNINIYYVAWHGFCWRVPMILRRLP